MTKRILIDSRWDGDTGIGRLYREVMARKPPEVDTTSIKSNLALGSVFTPLILTKEIYNTQAAIFYSPSFMPPLFSKIPFVFTVHDLMHLFYYSTLHKLYYKHVIGNLAKNAKQIITVSHYSKQQLVKLLGIKEQLITVIYNGVDEQFSKNEERYELPRPYFLYIGNRRKNKNIPAMLEAFAKANIPNDFIFALTGSPDESLNMHIHRLGIGERVRFLGFVSDTDLPKIYKGAFATLYVSLMEGFGLPIIESMASGTPVITSNTSSLPEIAGNAAICVDPLRINSISEGIELVVNNNSLYQQLVVDGKERAKDFKWEDTALQTWKTIIS